MIRDQRLLERIGRAEDGGLVRAEERATQADPNRLRASVIAHLRRILNTRQGSVAIDPDYGIPDFSQLPGSFAPPEAKRIEREIAAAVKRYEPRIHSVEVRFNGAPAQGSSMGFTLRATIEHEGRALDLDLATGVGADGAVSLE